MERILLIGCSGREHAMARALRKREDVELYSVMARRNPGIAALSTDVLICPETDHKAIMDWGPVKGGIEFAFIGPEAPLAAGMADILERQGVKVFGPVQSAAMIESSKSFLRDLMARHGVPGAVEYAVFDSLEPLKEHILGLDRDFVVKPVGLTGGKGVWVMGDHFSTPEEGLSYASRVITEGVGGKSGVVIEEKLVGEEFTLQVFTDGKHIRPMPLVQDHKRLLEGDRGPNTGGMGSYSCSDHLLPFLDSGTQDRAMAILQGIIDALRAGGIEYRGVLYGQFMLTRDGPRVIETNCRFGDPEAMNVLGLLESDLLDIARDIVDGRLKDSSIRFRPEASLVKYLVPEGYGLGDPVADAPVEIDSGALAGMDVDVMFASVGERDGQIYTSTSRAVALVGRGGSVPELCQRLNLAAGKVRGPLFHRKDIGSQGMLDEKVRRVREMIG